MTSAERTCAAPGCDNRFAISPGRVGRPRIYCGPQCRPSRSGAAGERVVVEIEHQPADEDGAPRDRSWAVRLRRGSRMVTVGQDFGRISAAVLAGELRSVLGLTPQEGGTIE